VAQILRAGTDVEVRNLTRDTSIWARHRLSSRQIDMLLAGGRIPGLPGGIVAG
jgi:aconitate hydratase